MESLYFKLLIKNETIRIHGAIQCISLSEGGGGENSYALYGRTDNEDLGKEDYIMRYVKYDDRGYHGNHEFSEK